MTETPLDRAHVAMMADPEATAPRLAFYDRLADAELHVLLTGEPTGDAPIAPQVFPTDEGPLIAAFDLPERLTDFAGGPAPYAALSGRGLAQELARGGMGLALNLGAASEIVLPAEAIAWLAAQLASAPRVIEAQPRAVLAPGAEAAKLVTPLQAKLASAAGLARAAILVQAEYDGDASAPLLALIDARPGAEAALAQAVAEAVAFSSGTEATVDVTFVPKDSDLAARLRRVGLVIDLPKPAAPPQPPAAPGMDPDRPPRLK